MLKNLVTKMKSLVKDESGATAIEYAVIAAILIAILVVGVNLIGTGAADGTGTTGMTGAFQNISDEL